MPGRHHQETRRNAHASKPDTEGDDQEEPKTHPLQSNSAEEDNQRRRGSAKAGVAGGMEHILV